MEFREATLDDLATLREFEQKVVEAERPFNTSIREGHVHYYDIEQLITDNNAFMCVGTDGGRIVATGYSQIRPSKESLSHDRHAYLGFMYVSADYRGQGINKDLTQHLLSWSRQKAVDTVYLDVYSENAAAIRAYEKAGFKASMIEMKLHV